MSSNRQSVRFYNTVVADWSVVPSGGNLTGENLVGAPNENYPVLDSDISGNNQFVDWKHAAIILPNAQSGDNVGSRSEGTPFFQQCNKILEYRREAESCFEQSDLTADRNAKLHWVTLAEAWLMMAGDMVDGCEHEDSGDLSYEHLQRENEGAVNPFLMSSIANRRRYRRQRVLKEGKITDSELRCLANIVIRDLSEGGARVQLSAIQFLPDKFGLYIVGERIIYPAVARWRKERTLGIQFVGEPHTATFQAGII
jgi:PilZ domain